MYSNPELVRESNLWIAFRTSRTIEGEGENERCISHTCGIEKFELPSGLSYGSEKLENNVGGAMRYYMFGIDHMDSMGKGRMINSADLPKEIVDLVPFCNIGPWDGKMPATVENAEKVDLWRYGRY